MSRAGQGSAVVIVLKALFHSTLSHKIKVKPIPGATLLLVFLILLGVESVSLLSRWKVA